jgi:hypothetical protein
LFEFRALLVHVPILFKTDNVAGPEPTEAAIPRCAREEMAVLFWRGEMLKERLLVGRIPPVGAFPLAGRAHFSPPQTSMDMGWFIVF